MSRTCELAACGRGGATKCGTAYLCPDCAPRIEALTAEYLAETPRPPFTEGAPVVWAGQSGAWLVHAYENDWTVWIYRPGTRMIPVVGRPGSGLVDLAPWRREPEHAELVPVAELLPAVALAGGAS